MSIPYASKREGLLPNPVEQPVVCDGIERTIQTLAYISESLPFINQQPLFSHNTVVIEYYSGNALTAQAANEEIALPFRDDPEV